jgi:hypothetical protein
VNLIILLVLPFIVYFFSYLYLAFYHGKIFIFNTIVHESGKYTLLEDIFYASHFLGHIPICIVLGLIFVGTYLCLTEVDIDAIKHIKLQRQIFYMVLFLMLSIFISLWNFGSQDTWAFVAQKKQSLNVYTQGGAWNLHFPSSAMLFLLIPIYLFLGKIIFKKKIHLNSLGIAYINWGLILFLSFTLFLNRHALETVFTMWTDPRYLAHSVRELATFPLTYFPLPLFFFLRTEKSDTQGQMHANRGFRIFIFVLAVLFLWGLIYQIYIPLTVGVEDLAQKPSFAKGGKLGVPYLLASHYFEHFLDTIFFYFLCVILYGLALRRNGFAQNKVEK